MSEGSKNRKVVDASVWMGWMKTDDPFHAVSKNFFEVDVPKKNIQVVVPSHLFFEINAKIRARKREGAIHWVAPFEMEGIEFYSIDMSFIHKCKESNIWDVLALPGVGSQDLIYATVAYIENITLVTADKGFRPLNEKIKLEILEPSEV